MSNVYNLGLGGYVKNKWSSLNEEVKNNGIMITLYDTALKVLSFVVLSLPGAGLYLFFILLGSSLVMDSAIFKQWSSYKRQIKDFFNGVNPKVNNAANKAQKKASVFLGLFGWMTNSAAG